MVSMKYSAVVLASLVAVTAACGASDASEPDVTISQADAEPIEPAATNDAAAEPDSESTVDQDVDAATEADSGTAETAAVAEAEPAEAEADESTVSVAEASGTTATFTAEVWADNWFALYVNGELVGEDSVPITTERSFNAETITFEASLPMTVAVEAKDFKETDSGIEYIGLNNQQMGDGGIILQISSADTGEVVAASSGTWSVLPIHRAPLNTECERDADPDATCQFEIIDAPADWTAVGFDDSSWSSATVWSEADVSPKDGYDQISWDASAELIWGTDLEVDNTVLLRTTAG